LIIGDAVHNLRSALDHLAWQLVESHAAITPGAPGPDENTAFPIYQTAPKKKFAALAKVQGMGPGAVSLLESLQPYNCGDNTLWELSKLDNIDKHRLLLVVALRQDQPEFSLIPRDGQTILCNVQLLFFATGDLKDGTEIAKAVGAGAFTQDVEFHVSFEIAFGETEIIQGKPVLPFLQQLSDFVAGIVNLFEPLL
jgi:hypothetical protein